jgi:hypothetical protein
MGHASALSDGRSNDGVRTNRVAKVAGRTRQDPDRAAGPGCFSTASVGCPSLRRSVARRRSGPGGVCRPFHSGALFRVSFVAWIVTGGRRVHHCGCSARGRGESVSRTLSVQSTTATVTRHRASIDAIARKTCERSHRSRISFQSPAGAAPGLKKPEATRESSVFCSQYLFTAGVELSPNLGDGLIGQAAATLG